MKESDELRRRSRWLLRVMEWNDSRARYPNIWIDGMPRHVLAFERIASRLRLGDLIAIYYPASQRHTERSEKFLGLSRAVGVRLAETKGYAWVDLSTVHRFASPLAFDQPPRRVFLCCDPGWPDAEVRLFGKVWDAALAEGWVPEPEDRESGSRVEAAGEAGRPAEPAPAVAAAVPRRGVGRRMPAGRLFAGVDYSGDMRDPREATWLAIVELCGDRLNVVRLDATGRHGLEGYLREPDATLMNVEAIGLDFPFSVPLGFAERLLGGAFPDEGWWALARKMETLSRPEYLVALQEYRDQHGESRRHTDEVADAFSPLHRVDPDRGPMTFHGIRMIAEDRSRYAVRPFESAQGRLLLEVYPGGFTRRLSPLAVSEKANGRGRRQRILSALGHAGYLPTTCDARTARKCLERGDALDAVIAARQAAVAVMTGEVERTPEQLAPDAAERVRREGWIYGLAEPE
ncbi:MAG TPA: DUF429 domain-containing protein [Candidatus Polarisedimenticolaceae bacterium]|nr:DUF429 domain-containing protein [Candidatus Polarisedimenticolaceae bacterium]